LDVSGFPRAGVLLAVLSRPAGPTVLFTQRTHTVSHPGQISFPGGRFEAGEDAARAALREAHEEVGLQPGSVRVVGVLDDRISINRMIVTPVVGTVASPPASFQPQAEEVREIFEVEVERLLNPSAYQEELRDVGQGPPPGWTAEEVARIPEGFRDLEPDGRRFRICFYDGGEGRVIWGLTARILKQFLDLAV
jgi:8-oxo-dGTP pyrophosphatase MutT (NUDIX family)